jgi:hypothetical protein
LRNRLSVLVLYLRWIFFDTSISDNSRQHYRNNLRIIVKNYELTAISPGSYKSIPVHDLTYKSLRTIKLQTRVGILPVSSKFGHVFCYIRKCISFLLSSKTAPSRSPTARWGSSDLYKGIGLLQIFPRSFANARTWDSAKKQNGCNPIMLR